MPRLSNRKGAKSSGVQEACIYRVAATCLATPVELYRYRAISTVTL